MDATGYFKLKDAWHSGNRGCSPVDILLAVSAASLSVFLAQLKVKTSSLLPQFIFLVIPLFLSLTDAAFNPKWTPLWLSILSLLSILKDRTFSFSVFKSTLSSPVPLMQAWITNFRALTYLVTAICILAVDFTIFPRRFAKTETFGLSLMDFGVSFFMICNGIVAKRETFSRVLKGVLILTVLGGFRLLSMKSVDYYEHVTEYGLHWNFFFTLAASRALNAMITRVVPMKPFWLALFLGLYHQAALGSGYQAWVLSEAPRRTFLEANREGIVSLAGYQTLIFAAEALGKLLRSPNTYGKLVLKLSFLCLLFWWLASACSEVTGVSRRLCNLGFILYTIAFACTLFLQLILINIVLQSTFKFWHVLPLLSSINKNGLAFFLIANLGTGMININMNTLLLTTTESSLVVLAYCMGLSMFVHYLYLYDVTLKFW